MKTYTWLVTGGCGFIGKEIVKQLLEQKQKVKILDISPLPNEFKGKVTFFNKDINDAAALKKACKNTDYILHQAAFGNVVQSFLLPLKTFQTNVAATAALLNAALEQKVKKLVFASSASVYGNAAKILQKESDCPAPISPYAHSKIMAENICKFFNDNTSLKTTSLRYFNVYGPQQKANVKSPAVTAIFKDSILKNKEIVIEGTGSQCRDFIFVSDVARANIQAALSDKANGNTYNVATGTTVTVKKLLKTMEDISGKKAKIKTMPARKGDILKSKADVTKIKKDLNFKPKTTLQEGIKKLFYTDVAN